MTSRLLLTSKSHAAGADPADLAAGASSATSQTTSPTAHASLCLFESFVLNCASFILLPFPQLALMIRALFSQRPFLAIKSLSAHAHCGLDPLVHWLKDLNAQQV